MVLTALLFTTLLGAPVQDGAQVRARLSATSAAVGETVVYEISVVNAAGDVDIAAPVFPQGLQVAGTQDFSEMQLSLPGGRTVTRRREFALLAVAPGRFRIPSATVTVGRKQYRTNAVDLVVSGTAPGRTLPSSNDAWLRATMEPASVYVGQQATLTIEAGFSEDVRVRLTRPPAFDLPSPTGFWVQDIPNSTRSRLQSVNGRVTEVQSTQRAFFPLSAGRFAFAPARAVIDVREGFLFAPETRELRSESPKLTVKALPSAGRPADFRGAVGTYTMRALVEPQSVSVGEAAQLTVEVTGRGNVKALPQPVLPALNGVEQFAPTEDATVNFDGTLAGGTKTFRWVIIPEQTGRITIPAISYSFFDPVQEAYRTVRSEPLVLNAVPAGAGVVDADSGAALRSPWAAPKRASLQWVRSHGFLLFQLVPLALVFVAFLLRRERKPKPAAELLRDRLHTLRAGTANFSEFLRDLEQIVRSAVADRTGDTTMRTAGTRALTDAMRGAGVPDEISTRVVTLIDRIETQRFTPAAAEQAERAALLAEAEALLDQLSGAARRSGATRHSALLVMAVLQAAQPASHFDTGMQLYREGHFDAASSAFQQAVAVDSTDLAAWAQLGNAYYRSGQRGHAVWAWAHAAREAPRERDLIHNLQTAGAVEILRTRPPLSVRAVEWYFLAAVGWWIACGIAIAAIWRRRAAILAWALPAVLIAASCLAAGMFADHARFAVALDEQTQLHGDPTVHSPVVRRVSAGVALDVLEQRGDWLRVRTVANEEGWVEEAAVGRL